MFPVTSSSTRRLLSLALLGLASALCVALVAVRITRTETPEYRFLLWNLFLAWLPFLFALALYDGYRRGRGRLTLAVWGVAWLLFLPNAPYILTDVVHLRDPGAAPLWYDAATVVAFAGTGLALGLGSLFLVQAVVTASRGALAGWTVSLVALALTSVGVYLGRFVGVNSWDAIVDPGRVAEPFLARLDDPLGGARFLAVTAVLTTFLAIAYALVYAVAEPGLDLDPRRRARR
jgi:uncharacterized membrane protein